MFDFSPLLCGCRIIEFPLPEYLANQLSEWLTTKQDAASAATTYFQHRLNEPRMEVSEPPRLNVIERLG